MYICACVYIVITINFHHHLCYDVISKLTYVIAILSFTVRLLSTSKWQDALGCQLCCRSDGTAEVWWWFSELHLLLVPVLPMFSSLICSKFCGVVLFEFEMFAWWIRWCSYRVNCLTVHCKRTSACTALRSVQPQPLLYWCIQCIGV